MDVSNIQNISAIQLCDCIRLFVDPPVTPAKGKKRGRPLKGERKEQAEAEDSPKKAKRTLDRFNGMSVEEVMARKLPDIITHNLDMLIVSFCS